MPDVAVGQRLVMTFLPRCGACEACATNGLTPCVPGSAANAAGTLMTGERRLSPRRAPIHHHLGVSGFATHAVVDRRSVVPVPADVPPEVAALLGCAVLTGGGAVINAGRPRAGDTVIVVGLGGVGMAAVLTALSHDDVRVIGVDQLPAKLELARTMGAHEAYTPDEAREAGLKAAVVIEAVGHPQAVETAVDLTAAGGRTVCVGLPRPDARINLSPLGFVAEGRSLIGSYLGSAVPSREIPHFVGLWRAGRLPVESLVSSRSRSTTSTPAWTNSPTVRPCGRSSGSTRRGFGIGDACAPQRPETISARSRRLTSNCLPGSVRATMRRFTVSFSMLSTPISCGSSSSRSGSPSILMAVAATSRKASLTH